MNDIFQEKSKPKPPKKTEALQEKKEEVEVQKSESVPVESDMTTAVAPGEKETTPVGDKTEDKADSGKEEEGKTPCCFSSRYQVMINI
jgi:hypothetical protein